MNLVVMVIGVFFAVEGGANLVWWHFFPPHDSTNSKMETVWEIGRFLRTGLGLVLVALGL